MYEALENNQILKIIGEGHKIGYCMDKIIELNNESTAVNTTINIPITYKTFNLETGVHDTDTTINKSVEVYVNNVLQGTETIVNGTGNIEFQSVEIGTFTIKVDGVTCEVTVNEN